MDQGPDRGKRKRPYHQRVICAECKRELDSDHKDNHAKTVHKRQKSSFRDGVRVQSESTCFFQ